MAFVRRLCGLPAAALRVPWLPVSLVCVLASPAAATTSTETPIEEITVTARKFEERLARVPMSIQVLSGEFLDTTDVSSLLELQYDVPGLVTSTTGLFGNNYSLRGVSNQGGGAVAVAPYLDGVYAGNTGEAVSRLFDVERVEVLKGPQGALYGRNATGGAINFISRLPQDSFTAALETAYGSFNTRRIEGHVNFPVRSGGFRLALAGADGDGYMRNTADSRKFAEDDYFAIRASLLLEPTSSLSITTRWQQLYDDGASTELWLPRMDHLPDPRDIYLTTVQDPAPYLKLGNDSASVDISYDFGNASIQSITAWSRSETRNRDDCAGSPILRGCVRGAEPLTYDQWSQELHLRWTSSSVDWLAGLLLLDGEEEKIFFTNVPLISPIPVRDGRDQQQHEATALFGQIRTQVAPKWHVSAGARYSDERHRVSTEGKGLADADPAVSDADSWNNLSWRLGVEHVASETTFVYANVSTGFKSGGIVSELLATGEFDHFEPETLTAWEAGVDRRSAGGRGEVRASAFVYDFEDLQVGATIVSEAGILTVVDNAAAALIYGLDVSGRFGITDHLSVNGGLVWLPVREFVEFVSEGYQEDFSGNDLVRAPEWSATFGFDWRIPVRGGGEFSASLDYNYRSDYYFRPDNNMTLSQPAFSLLNVYCQLEQASKRSYVFVSARNILDTEYFTQVFIQSAAGHPATFEAGFGLRF